MIFFHYHYSNPKGMIVKLYIYTKIKKMLKMLKRLFSKSINKTELRELIEVALTAKRPHDFVLLLINWEYVLCNVNNIPVNKKDDVKVLFIFDTIKFKMLEKLGSIPNEKLEEFSESYYSNLVDGVMHQVLINNKNN